MVWLIYYVNERHIQRFKSFNYMFQYMTIIPTIYQNKQLQSLNM